MLSILNVPYAMFGLEHQRLAEQLAEPGAIQRLTADPKALQALHPFKAKGGERLGIRDGIGFLYATGPLVKRHDAISKYLGATTYEALRRDLQAALDNKGIQAIALYVDSPGGEASGCDELAAAIYEARGKKPLAAYISGQGCSAAYWLATAAGKVTVSDAAIVGSVGIVQTYQRENGDGARTVTFVSEQSPNKGFVPDRIQSLVNAMGEVFASHVAKYRGLSKDDVHSWKGNVKIGANAVKAGMVDSVGSFEDVIADLKKRPVPISAKPLSLAKPAVQQTPKIAAPTPAPTVQLSQGERVRVKAMAEAQAQETARIREIFQKIRSQEAASHYAYDTHMTADEALADMNEKSITAGWQRAVASAGFKN